MNAYLTALECIAQIKNLEQWAYHLGYINALYAHNIITTAQYNTLFELIQIKKECL